LTEIDAKSVEERKKEAPKKENGRRKRRGFAVPVHGPRTHHPFPCIGPALRENTEVSHHHC